MKALHESNYRVCGSIKDPSVFVKGDDADDWDTKTSYSASERPRDVFKKY